jgi:hypothetical protein
LTADDGESTASDTITITVEPQNQAPSVDAGSDQTVVVTDAVSLDGTVADDGLPNPPGSLIIAWSLQSGPGTVTFGDAASVDTTANFSAAGDYVVALSATDGALAASDSVTVTVTPPANRAPTVDAGPDQAVAIDGAASLDGTVADDGLPNPPASVTTAWSTQSGPGTVTFADPAAVDTSATFSAEGVYVLEFSAADGEFAASDTVTVTVLPGNQAPSVDAGTDLTVSVSSGASLDGTVNDDGLPNPPSSVTTAWSVQSGPGTVTFGDGSSVDTTATFSTDGTYVLQLSADEGAVTPSEVVTIPVTPPTNQAPAVDHGTDRT